MASTAPPSTALATLKPDILVSGSLRNHSSTQRKTHRSENAKKLHPCLGNIGELPILIDTTLGVWRFGTFWNQTITHVSCETKYYLVGPRVWGLQVGHPRLDDGTGIPPNQGY